MRGYGQYCPIALAAEVFAERWTPIVLRNLMVGADRFGEILAGAPGIPRSVLAQRLRSLEQERIVDRVREGRVSRYRLTPCGRELAEVCLALGVWGARWREVRPEDRDPYLVLWTLCRLVDAERLPRPRVVVRFEIRGRSRPPRYWLVLGGEGNEVCAHDPGFTEDGVVTTDPAWLVRWHTGEVSLGAAMRAGGMAVEAPRWLERALDGWGRLSPFADVRRVAAG
ncbi:MAG TPA: helix-turn-helix domain-containing protein [Pseudonocardia sp.]|nr:helix-turn-helix domain-containing protein [Pseudonocardia sp.]